MSGYDDLRQYLADSKEILKWYQERYEGAEVKLEKYEALIDELKTHYGDGMNMHMHFFSRPFQEQLKAIKDGAE